MARSKPATSAGIDVADLMEVICGYRKEAFPFEKYVAIMTFSSWLYSSDLEFNHQARIIATALLIRAIHRGALKVDVGERQSTIDRISKLAFINTEVADVMVGRALQKTYKLAMRETIVSLFHASSMAAFIVRCPLELKPSVNKAVFFIDEGGFSDAYDIVDYNERAKPYKASHQTLRSSWTSFATSSPFVIAAHRLNMTSIIELGPDYDESISQSKSLLGNTKKLNHYFGLARSIQDELLKRLDKASRARFEFCKFSGKIPPYSLKPRAFDSHQLGIIDRYEAPMFLPKDPQPPDSTNSK